MNKTQNIESNSNKMVLKVKIILGIVFVVAVGLNINGLIKSGILSMENGAISINEYKIPFYGWAKEVKDIEKQK
ncbi:hypothetical protein ACOTWR_06455 [Aliarcobacter butzleri]|uniref:hypothetical protein n=1 Tax=Aliarcobacter butzleri TaxID=28197 RepID=UPI0021B311E6|nr:hypothetical protein [Aliarcobacter butzleri]MCT7647636.1 hypothetical protein [Aliarcobacter butzleri]